MIIEDRDFRMIIRSFAKTIGTWPHLGVCYIYRNSSGKYITIAEKYIEKIKRL